MKVDNKNIIFGYVAPLIAIVTLVAYGYTTIYYKGYLSAFDIDISSVNFQPAFYDIAFHGTVSCMLAAISIGGYFLMNWVLTAVGELLKKQLTKMHKSLSWLRMLKRPSSSRYNLIASILVILLLTFFIVYSLAEENGLEAGREQRYFTVYEADNTKNALIYQSGNTGVFKQYNQHTRSFDPGYTIDTLDGKKFERIDLKL